MNLTIKTFLAILALSTITFGQTPDNDALFGTFNVRNDAARICLATAGPSGAPWCWNSMGFEWHNGPPGEETYLNHTGGFGYNVQFNGTKVVPGLVSYMFSSESKFRNPPGGFMTEHHFNWASPDNAIRIRPLGFTVQYDTGNVDLTVHGAMSFLRNFSNGGSQWGKWHDDGFLDLRTAPNGVIAFKNNSAGAIWANSAGTNTINPVRVGPRDEVLVGGNQQATVITSERLTYSIPQCGSIPDSNGTDADNARVINSLLNCLRSNQFLPQNQSNLKLDVPVCVAPVQSSKPASVQVKRSKRGRIID